MDILRYVLRLMTFVSATLLSVTAYSANVLVLEGFVDAADTQVTDDLAAAGHTVTVLPYQDWTGANPAPTGFDIVMLLIGNDYGFEIGSSSGDEDAAAAALLAYVNAGGVFLASEWTAYDLRPSGPAEHLRIEALMPFERSSYENYDYGSGYQVVLPGPLTAGLAASWPTYAEDGGVCIDLKPGTVTHITRTFEDGDCVDTEAALVTMTYGAGRSIWFNSDLNDEDGDPTTAEQLQVLRNAADFAAALRAGPTQVPVLPPVALGLLIAMLAGLGIRRARRH